MLSKRSSIILSMSAIGSPAPDADPQVQQPQADQQTVELFLPRAPTTRYYGSKRKLLAWIHDAVAALEFHSVLDLFGGTGSVSLLFKAMGKKVTYHDGLAFNADVAHSVLADRLALNERWVADYLGRIRPRHGVVSSNFEGVFYTTEENEWIDGFMAAQAAQTLGDQERRLLRYLLYQACLKKRPFNLFHRANLAIRTRADVQRSFGNLTTWNKSFSDHIMASLRELRTGLVRSPLECNVLPPMNAEGVAPGYDLVYLDPPYVGHRHAHNRDNYWRKYHFLEGLARYDEWAGLIDHTLQTKCLTEPAWMHDWSNKALFRDLLFATIRRHRQSIVVLSYVADGIPHHDEIGVYFADQFSSVNIFHRQHQYALSGKAKKEILFIGMP